MSAALRINNFLVTDDDPLNYLGFTFDVEVAIPHQGNTFYEPMFTIVGAELCIRTCYFNADNERDVNILKFILKEVIDPVMSAGVVKKKIYHAGSIKHLLAQMCVNKQIRLQLDWIDGAMAAHERAYVDFSIDERAAFNQMLLWRSPIKTNGYVYLIQSPTGYYKIGRTKNPNDRLKTFGVKLPFEVEYAAVIQTHDMYTLEKTFHEIYAPKRVNGEWFDLVDYEVKHIKSLAAVES